MTNLFRGSSRFGALLAWPLGALALAAGCAAELDLEVDSSRGQSFEAWRATLPVDDTGAYIVEGDLPIVGERALRRYFDEEMPQPGALTVKVVGGVEQRWSGRQKYDLTYCVSTDLGSFHGNVVAAMAAAAGEWERAAEVRFVYVPGEDGNCTRSNTNVLFNVRYTDSDEFIARAFTPDDTSRAARELLLTHDALYPSAPRTTTGIILHELGHVLGFKHEHIWDGGCTSEGISEGTSNSQRLTANDTASVMYYVQCANATNTYGYQLTLRDEHGAACKYNLAMPRSSCDAAATSTDYIWFSNGTNRTFWSSLFQLSGYPHPITGDFDGDGRHDIVWYGRGYWSDAIWWGRTDGSFDIGSITIGGLYEPVTGDFDADGYDDIFWYGGRTRTDYVWYGKANRTFTSKTYTVSEAVLPVAGDFDGDGGTDIFFYGVGSNFDKFFWSNRDPVYRTFTVTAATIGGNYLPVAGDYDGDLRDDLLFFDSDASVDPVWFAAPGRQFNAVTWDITGPYQPVVGNFDNRYADDIIWYIHGPGPDYVYWSIPGGYTTETRYIDGHYAPAVGDFSGDGYDDILWFAPSP